METSRPVVVKRMPERVNQREARKFLQDVRPFLTADRPQLVFDHTHLTYGLPSLGTGEPVSQCDRRSAPVICAERRRDGIAEEIEVR